MKISSIKVDNVVKNKTYFIFSKVEARQRGS